ncbi:hypothetical protein [Yersinia pestis]|uniref:hypothetical protein n=1 Tax=Yersinia pestis TaxID=632 RepID=UPI00138662A8|nr:hypothetical protein [Yersinia pestis]
MRQIVGLLFPTSSNISGHLIYLVAIISRLACHATDQNALGWIGFDFKINLKNANKADLDQATSAFTHFSQNPS